MKCSNRNLLLSIIILIVAVSPANSHCPSVYTFTGEAGGDRLGVSVASAGDVNNDGFDDLIVGANHKDAGAPDAGRAYVFSGLNGDTLYVFTGEAGGDLFGSSVATAGDVNNDGFDDLIVGAHGNNAGASDAGRAYVFSGQTGDTLYVFTGEAEADNFGNSVASAGDVNNDGFDDIIVGALLNSAGGEFAGRAYVFSGQTGDTLYVFTGEATGDLLGSSVASAGDVNNDGFDDVIVGARLHDAGGENAGVAYVFSGLNGDTLHVLIGETEHDWFGHSVASAGDVNNDGFDDLLVGAFRYNGGSFDNGRAYVFCGQSGDLIYVFTGEAGNDEFGNSVASAGDVNNDGFDDLIVGAFRYNADGSDNGRAYVYNTLDLSCVGNRGDLNGDGYDANILDLTFLVDFIFRGSGDPGPCTVEGDVNTDGVFTNILDLTFLVDRIFRGGPAPGPC